jgi:peptidoglycan/xylan/chitin deacetylase (PgdA/CDA1 family)
VHAKTIAKTALRRLGSAVRPDAGSRVVVLCYHSVHPSLPFRSVTPAQLSDHLAWLSERCDCIPFDDVLSAHVRGRGRPTVAITFDDGYADNHEFALPALVERQIAATFFLTAGLVERDLGAIERFRRLRRVEAELIRPLDWAQVREMRAAGMTIGGHTHTHPNLATLPRSQLAYELQHSKEVIEDRIGQSVTMLAYPFGRPRVHVTAEVLEAARRGGYELAASVAGRGVRPTDAPLSVPRIFVANDTVETLREKVLGVWDLIGSVRERMPLAVARAVSPADFDV